jgi:hypothetical protein
VRGGREELRTRCGSLSSEGANAEVQAERSTPIKVLRSLEYCNALILNANTTFNFINGAHLHGKRYTRIVQFLNPHQHTATFEDRQIHFRYSNYIQMIFSRPLSYKFVLRIIELAHKDFLARAIETSKTADMEKW